MITVHLERHMKVCAKDISVWIKVVDHQTTFAIQKCKHIVTSDVCALSSLPLLHTTSLNDTHWSRFYRLLSFHPVYLSINSVAWSDKETHLWNVREAWLAYHTRHGFAADSPHWIPWQPCMEGNLMLPNVYRLLDTVWGCDFLFVLLFNLLLFELLSLCQT